MRISKVFDKEFVLSLKAGVAESAKLPLSKCRGSAEARRELASQYTQKFIEELDKTGKKKSCSVDSFTKALNDTLGENKINFSIGKLNDSHSAGAIEREIKSSTKMSVENGVNYIDTDSKITGYTFYFPLKKNNTVIEDKSTAVHEVRHFFDYICNPKTVNSRSNKLLYESDRLKSFNNIYRSFMNDYPSIMPTKIFNFVMKRKINKMPNEDAIDLLQTVRGALKTEINAYGDELNYCKKKPVKNIVTMASVWDVMNNMRFKKKLLFTEEMLAEKLEESRNMIH